MKLTEKWRISVEIFLFIRKKEENCKIVSNDSFAQRVVFEKIALSTKCNDVMLCIPIGDILRHLQDSN